MKIAHVVPFPPFREGQGTACYYIATALRELGVDDYYNDVAVLVEPKNSKELSRAIIELLSDPSNSEKLGQAGRELVQSHFTWEKIARRTEEIYNNILAE